MMDLNNFELAIEIDWQAREARLEEAARVRDLARESATAPSVRRHVAEALVAAAALLYPPAVPVAAR